jgi:hypothetical protein
MKLVLGTLLAATMLAHNGIAQEKADYDFKSVKLKFDPSQKFREGLSYDYRLPDGTKRLTKEQINFLRPSLAIDMKLKGKGPDIVFKYDFTGIEIKEVRTLVENNTYFKLIDYVIKSKVDILKAADNSLVKDVSISDGSVVKSIKVGSNFFSQTKSFNSKFPKPKNIPNIDESPGTVADFDVRFALPKPIGFTSLEAADEFLKTYKEVIDQRAEALAIDTELSKGAEMLSSMFGTEVYRGYIGLASIAAKGRTQNFEDFDKANADFETAFNLVKDNSADVNALNTFTQLYAFYKKLEEEKDARLGNANIRAAVYFNQSVLAAFNNDIVSAEKYYTLYDGMKEKKWQYAAHLENLIKAKRKKVPVGQPSQELLSGL